MAVPLGYNQKFIIVNYVVRRVINPNPTDYMSTLLVPQPNTSTDKWVMLARRASLQFMVRRDDDNNYLMLLLLKTGFSFDCCGANDRVTEALKVILRPPAGLSMITDSKYWEKATSQGAEYYLNTAVRIEADDFQIDNPYYDPSLWLMSEEELVACESMTASCIIQN